MRHRTRQYLAFPLRHRQIRRRVLRGILSLLPRRHGVAADGHGARHRTRRQTHAVRCGEGADTLASGRLAGPGRDLLRRVRRADDLLHDRDGLDALLHVRLPFRRALRAGHRGDREAFRRPHRQPVEERPLHVHHGRRRVRHLRRGAEERCGAHHEDPDERAFRPAPGPVRPCALPAGREGRTEILPHAEPVRGPEDRAFRSGGRRHGTGVLHAQPGRRQHHDLRQLHRARPFAGEGIPHHHHAGHRRGSARRHRDLSRMQVLQHRRFPGPGSSSSRFPTSSTT